jgi:uncharacterized membrane protein
MEGVDRVEQVDDTHLHWVAEIAGQRREWDAVITEQIPDERVAWTSTDGATNAGVVTFHRLGDTTTKVMLQLEFDPDGIGEAVADKLGFVEHRAKGDLARFRDFITAQPGQSGAWRGRVDRSGVTPPTS